MNKVSLIFFYCSFLEREREREKREKREKEQRKIYIGKIREANENKTLYIKFVSREREKERENNERNFESILPDLESKSNL
jgi:hypothetical protein